MTATRGSTWAAPPAQRRALCLLLLLAGAGARAESSAFSLAWSAPKDCAPRPDVGALLGDARGEAAVTIAPLARGWELRLSFSAPVAGERVLRTDTCREAVEAALLLLRIGAHGVPPDTAETTSPTQPDTPTPPEAPVTPTPEETPPPPPLPTPATAFAALVASVGVQTTVLPSAAPRFGVQGWLGRGPLSVFASVATGVSTRYDGGPSPHAGVEVWPVMDAVLAGCVTAHRSAVRLGGCVDLEAGWWRLRGVGVSLPREGDAALLAMGPAVRALVTFGRLALLVGAAARPTLLRPRASFDGREPTLEAGALVLEATAGLGLSW